MKGIFVKNQRAGFWAAALGMSFAMSVAAALPASAAPAAHAKTKVHPAAKPVRVDDAVAPAPAVPSLLKRNFSSNEINACLDSICGGAQQNWPFLKSLLQRKTPTKEFQTFWAQKIQPDLAQAVKADADAEGLVVDRLTKLIQAGKLPKLGHPMQAVAMQTVLSNIFIMPYLQYLLVPNPLTHVPEIDQDFFTQVLRNAPSLSQRAGIELLVKNVYLPMFQGSYHESIVGSGNDLKNRLTVRFPDKELADALKLDAQALLDSYGKIRDKFGKFTTRRMIDETSIALVKRALGGADLSKVDSDAYLKVAQSIETSVALMEPTMYKTLMAIQVDPGKTISNLKTEGAIGKKHVNLALFNAAKRTATIGEACSGRLSLALNASATPEQIQTLQDAIPAIKTAAKALLSNYADASMLAALDAEIDKTEFSFPPSGSDSTAEVKSAISDFAAQAAQTKAEMSAVNADLDQVLLWSAPEILAEQDQVNEPLIDVCGRLPSDELTDHTLTATGRVSLSWFTAAYPELGLSILTHELGHVVSAALRASGETGGNATAFLKSLTCVANRNPFVIKPATLNYADNTTWSEEDWADHFSTKLTDSLSGSGLAIAKTPHNLACTIAFTDDVNSVAATFAPADEDPHSSTLMRALNITFDRGDAITPSCKAFTAYAVPQHRALTCD